jgi:transcriptional antiterminator RfaH
MQSTTEKRWYLIQCKPRQDFRALEHLVFQGYECILPTHQIEKLRKGQWSRQTEPLFPGYLFIELDTKRDNWMPIRSTRGVSQIVRFGEAPLPVPGKVIQRLRNQPGALEHEFNPGDKVLVDWGGATELEAIFLAKDGSERVLLLLNLLHREVQVIVPTRGLVKAS